MSGVTVTMTWRRLDGKPTIADALAERLGRVPTNAELCAEVRRILQEARP